MREDGERGRDREPTYARECVYKTQKRKERPAKGSVEAESYGWAPYLEGT